MSSPDDFNAVLPLVATVEDGAMYVDGEAVDTHPYRRALRSQIAYYPVGTDTSVIESYMDSQDSAYCGANRGSPSYTFRNETGHHSFKVLSAEVWGIADREPEIIRAKIEALIESVSAEDWKWSKTVASLAGRVCREHSSELRQLPPRWRTLAHSGISQGPTTCIRGGSSNAIAWDRKEAFLRALFEPVPLRDSWIPLSAGASWKRYTGRPGLIRATVRIDPDRFSGRIPPLPVRHVGTTVYPVGIVRGVWVTGLLDDAVNAGDVEVIEVHEAATCVTEPIHAWAGERISKIGENAVTESEKERAKTLRKLLYTRYWGRLAATGGWRGTVLYPEEAEPNTVHRFPGSMLYWVWDGYNLEDHDCSPDYRPDHAAFIASMNHRRMNEVIRTIPKDRIIGTHVDAVWCDDLEWRPNGDDFAVKGKGPLRFYGIGTYQHGPWIDSNGRQRHKLAAQGYEGPKLNAERLTEWGEGLHMPRDIRRWRPPEWARPVFDEDGAASYGNEWECNPAKNPDVYSDPPLQAFEPEPGAYRNPDVSTWIPVEWKPGRLPTIYDKRWTRKGWIHREPAEEPEDTESEGRDETEV